MDGEELLEFLDHIGEKCSIYEKMTKITSPECFNINDNTSGESYFHNEVKWKDIAYNIHHYCAASEVLKKNRYSSTLVRKYLTCRMPLSKLAIKSKKYRDSAPDILKEFIVEASEAYELNKGLDIKIIITQDKTKKNIAITNLEDLRKVLPPSCILAFKEIYGYNFWNKSPKDLKIILIDEEVSCFRELAKKKDFKTFPGKALTLYKDGGILGILDEVLLPILNK